MLSIHFLLHSEPARFRNVGELSRIAKLLDTGREERKMHPPAEHASQCQMLDGDVQSRVRNRNEFSNRLPTGISTFSGFRFCTLCPAITESRSAFHRPYSICARKTQIRGKMQETPTPNPLLIPRETSGNFPAPLDTAT